MIFFLLYISSLLFCGLAGLAMGRMSKGGALGLELARAIRQRDAMEALASKYLERQIVAVEEMKTQQGRAARAEFDLKVAQGAVANVLRGQHRAADDDSILNEGFLG